MRLEFLCNCKGMFRSFGLRVFRLHSQSRPACYIYFLRNLEITVEGLNVHYFVKGASWRAQDRGLCSIFTKKGVFFSQLKINPDNKIGILTFKFG